MASFFQEIPIWRSSTCLTTEMPLNIKDKQADYWDSLNKANGWIATFIPLNIKHQIFLNLKYEPECEGEWRKIRQTREEVVWSMQPIQWFWKDLQKSSSKLILLLNDFQIIMIKNKTIYSIKCLLNSLTSILVLKCSITQSWVKLSLVRRKAEIKMSR